MKFKALRELAEILETADEKHIAAGEPTYDQSTLDHTCGTPACALGHWLHVHPEHREYSTPAEHALFEIDNDGWAELFGGSGCGGAKTSKEAAAYIRGFIARKSNS